ncbi:hypothetical protein AOLI_G00128670 [Acnodon oligacanthus]
MSASKLRKLFGKSKSLEKDSRDREKLGSPPSPEPQSPDALPTSPAEKKKRRFGSWRSKKKSPRETRDPLFLTSTDDFDTISSQMNAFLKVIIIGIELICSSAKLTRLGPRVSKQRL